MFCIWEIHKLKIYLSYLPIRLQIATFMRKSIALLLLKYKSVTFMGNNAILLFSNLLNIYGIQEYLEKLLRCRRNIAVFKNIKLFHTYNNFSFEINLNCNLDKLSQTTCPIWHFVCQNIFIHLPKTKSSITTVSFFKNPTHMVFLWVKVSCKS